MSIQLSAISAVPVSTVLVGAERPEVVTPRILITLVLKDRTDMASLVTALMSGGYTFRVANSISEVCYYSDPCDGRLIICDTESFVRDRGGLSEKMLQSLLPVTWMLVGRDLSVQRAVTAMRSGISSVLQMPVLPSVLEKTLQEAIEDANRTAAMAMELEDLKQKFGQLTDKEARVVSLLLEGFLNKTIASKLNVSLRTVEVRRQRVYEKLGMRSLAKIVRGVDRKAELERYFDAVKVPSV